MELRNIIREELYRGVLTNDERRILEDILGKSILNEGIDFNTILGKVKAYAAKGLLTGAILTSLMASTALSQQQKAQIKTTVAGSSINTPQTQIKEVTPELRLQWNNFIDWIGKTYPGGISDKGVDSTAQIASAYQKANPNSSITSQNIQVFQKDLQEYNQKWFQLQSNPHPQGNTLSSIRY